MKVRLLRWLGLLCWAASATILSAQGNNWDAGDTKLLALEHAWDLAISTGDEKALDALLDNELIFVDSDGSLMNKTQLLERIKSSRPEQFLTESMTVQVFDDTAIVNGIYRTSELKNGKPAIRRAHFTNTWMYKNFTWVCITSQATPILE
jgi:hypothetical protein